MTIKATRVLSNLPGFRGVAHLYKLSEAVEYGYGEIKNCTDCVVISAAVPPFSGPEVVIFPAKLVEGFGNPKAEMISCSVIGSVRGTLSHQDVIAYMGWEEQ